MRVLRLPELIQKIGNKRSWIYEQLAKDKFPKPILIGKNSVGWIDEEVDQWLAARIAERDSGKAA